MTGTKAIEPTITGRRSFHPVALSGTALPRSFPATLADGRQILLPIRPAFGPQHALASLIINQASFEVEDAPRGGTAADWAALPTGNRRGSSDTRPDACRSRCPQARHKRYVPLGTSRKFWYVDDLSVPLSSITTPGQKKRLYVDPRMLPLLRAASRPDR